MNTIRVYDQNKTKLAYLDKAFGIGYDLALNALHTAQFTLPADDPKNAHCQQFNLVEIFDNGQRIELFRIMKSDLERGETASITYQCEHVLGTLLDDVLFKYHQIGNTDIGTIAVLRYILDRQTTGHWQLSECDFDRRFEYKWENENLLSALFSVPQPFNETYRWTFDTTGTIWRLSLKMLPTEFSADIVYKKNMTGIRKETDPTNVITRLYCLGYGEGDNQLDISSVNNGVPYLEVPGPVKSSILVERRFENAEMLKAYGQTILDRLKDPYRSYDVSCIDLALLDPAKYVKFRPGDLVRVIDKEDSIIENLPIIKVSKSDLAANPGDVSISIANATRDIAGSISALADRARINEVYAQGATNQMIVPFSDNADASHPAKMRFYIPASMARINICLLNYQLEPFRAFSRAVQGGGGSATSTSSGGGGSQTSEDGGGTTTSSGGSSWYTDSGYSSGLEATDRHGDHNHGISDGTRLLTEDGSVEWVESGRHEHVITLNHSHDVDVPEHSHRIYLNSHSHDVSFPTHTHGLYFGIYQGSTASGVTILVDGVQIPRTSPGEDVDLIPHLSTDESGRINRDTWHEITLIPDIMTRITANAFMQIFTNSRGGGDY